MPLRNRTRNNDFSVTGNCKVYIPTNTLVSTVNTNSGLTLNRESCTDAYAAGRGDHTLQIDLIDMSTLPTLDGTMLFTFGPFPAKAVMSNFAPSGPFSASSLDSVSWSKSDAGYIASFLAETSPNRYDVNNLQNIVDLKDLPKMVKLAGDTILKKGAGAYLNYQFGWAPLINDLKRMLDFQGRAAKRVREIHALYQNGGLHRKRDLDRASSETSTTSAYTVFSGTDLTWKHVATTTARKWATVRWLPTTLPPLDDAAIRTKAYRLVFGAELSPSAIWEALPWTWLIDWFSDIGDYLVLYNNLIPCQHSVPCIMTHVTTKRTITRTDSHSDIGGGTGYVTIESKTRQMVDASLTAGIPFLSGFQMSILGALSIVKHRAR